MPDPLASSPAAALPAADHRLVFVGGLHRSGTSLITRCLGEHPHVSRMVGTGVSEDEGQHLQAVLPSARSLGGPGRFSSQPGAHLTERSPLASAIVRQQLLASWSPYWDLSRRHLVEKSPPNLLRTRLLQALFPEASFVIVVRHPAVVALATRKWAPGVPLDALLDHWLCAHEIFAGDAPRVRPLLVVRYEALVARPRKVLADVARHLALPGAIPTVGIDPDRNLRYVRHWLELVAAGDSEVRRTMTDPARAARIRRFGYSLHRPDGSPPGRRRTWRTHATALKSKDGKDQDT